MRTTISDQLSSSLNDLQNELEVSDLYENIKSRKHVLARAIPRTLVDKVSLDTLMKRLPEQVSQVLSLTDGSVVVDMFGSINVPCGRHGSARTTFTSAR